MSGITKLVELYRSTETAPLFFEELASMRSPKPKIDIERRRMAVNDRHGVKLNRTVSETFFRALDELGYGKLRIIKERSSGNSHFEWTYYEQNCIDVAKAVIDAASGKSPTSKPQRPIRQPLRGLESSNETQVRGRGDTFVFRLSNGQILRLDINDIRELQEFFRTVL